MGCDIHTYMEYKVGNEKWKAIDRHVKTVNHECGGCSACKANKPEHCKEPYFHYNELICYRDYEVFARLAGVRGESKRSPRGMPKLVSDTIREACNEYGLDGHSHSYLSLSEFKKEIYYLASKHTQQPPNKVNRWKGDPYIDIVKLGEDIQAEKTAESFLLGDKKPCKVRVVFWFDN
jgi:hypothetical protein